jgi:hypothetical protein
VGWGFIFWENAPHGTNTFRPEEKDLPTGRQGERENFDTFCIPPFLIQLCASCIFSPGGKRGKEKILTHFVFFLFSFNSVRVVFLIPTSINGLFLHTPGEVSGRDNQQHDKLR